METEFAVEASLEAAPKSLLPLPSFDHWMKRLVRNPDFWKLVAYDMGEISKGFPVMMIAILADCCRAFLRAFLTEISVPTLFWMLVCDAEKQVAGACMAQSR